MTIHRLVRRERSRLRSVLAARGVGAGLAAMACVLAGAIFSLGGARWITWPVVPLAAWTAALLLALAALVWTSRAVRHGTSPARLAREIERDQTLRSGALRGALEVSGSGALGTRAANALASHLSAAGTVLAPSVYRRVVRHRALAAAGAVFALLLLGAARSAAPDGWLAMRHPVGAFTGSLLPPIQIEHPPGFVMRGEKLRLRVSAPERRRLEVHVRTTGAAWDTLSLPISHGVGTTVLGPLDADLTLVATDGRVSSDTVAIRVTDRPFVGDVAIRATYPRYLGRPAETMPLGEPARVPRGTVLSISGRASTDLRSVGLLHDQDSVHLEADGHGFAGRLVALASAHFTWFANGAAGAIPDVPQPLDLEVVVDSAPRVEILAPARDTVVLPDAQLALRIAASDDHGLADITLESRRQVADGALMPAVAQTLASPGAPRWTGDQNIDLSPRGLQPGDALQITVAATDNSPWRQRSQSRTLVLRVPSLSEQRQQARALADSTVSQLAAATKTERELAERTGEAARTRTDRPQRSSSSANSSDWSTERPQDAQPRTMSYQGAEQARAIAKDQQELQNQVRDAQRKAAALERQLRAAGALDSSLASKLRDVQQMLRDALTPELQQQLDDVLKAAQRLSPEQARQALQNLAQQQKQLRDALERSTEMLRRAGLEGSMQTLKDEASEIARNEQAMADSLSRETPPTDSAAVSRRASKLSGQSRQLAEDVQQLQKRLQQDKAQAGPASLTGAPQHADTSSDAMQRVATAGGGAAQRAQRSRNAQEGARQMEQAARQLATARDQQIQEWKQQLTGELDQSIQETMQLARRQQQLADRARTGKDEDLRPDQSAVQQGVRQVQRRLQSAARQSAHISAQSQGALGDASRRVQEATESTAQGAATGERDRAQTAGAMVDAAQALNRAAAQMMKDRANAASGSSASGFAELLQRMREAAKAQGGVNSGTAGLLPMPGGQPSAQMIAEARALANQQRAIAQQLDDAGNGEARAAQLAREMRQIAASLDRGRVDQQLLDRQQKLFHRLLDAGLTLEKDEREDTGKRESQVGGDNVIINNGAAVHGQAVERYREPGWNELRGLTAEERRAVLDYFKRINASDAPHP